MTIKWKLRGPIERKLMDQVVDRALMLFADQRPAPDRQNLMMDLTACHLNGIRLNLVRLRDFDDFNFIHDVAGISRHIDRTTGKLQDHFVPRCAWTAADGALAQESLLRAIFRKGPA